MSEVALFDAPDTTDQSTKEEAESRADRIRAGMVAVTTLPEEIKAAWQRHDWSALGYITWDGYIHGEFGEHRLPMITREQRVELAMDLTSGGLTTRAVAAVLGVGNKTVARDLIAAVSNDTAADLPDRVTGADGKSYPRTRPNPQPAEVEQNRAKLAELDDALNIAPDRIMDSGPRPIPEPTPEPKVMLSHEVVADQTSDEEQRRRLVATHLLCEVAVSFAQCRGTATFSRYDPTKALPGRAVTLDVLRNVRAAADEAIAVWTERGLQ